VHKCMCMYGCMYICVSVYVCAYTCMFVAFAPMHWMTLFFIYNNKNVVGFMQRIISKCTYLHKMWRLAKVFTQSNLDWSCHNWLINNIWLTMLLIHHINGSKSCELITYQVSQVHNSNFVFMSGAWDK
jgi:hypothetical protein